MEPQPGPGTPHLPLRPQRHEALVSVRRTAACIDRRLAHAVAPAGISVQQLNILAILRPAGTVGMPTMSIADRLVERAPGITRLLDAMERRGLVTRARGSDRRKVVCQVTSKGLRLLESLDREIDEINQQIFAPLTRNEVAAVAHMLERVCTALDRAESERNQGNR